MNIGSTAKKLVLFRTIEELKPWSSSHDPNPFLTGQAQQSPVNYLKDLMHQLYLDHRLDGLYESLCPDHEMLEKIFISNTLAAALLTFSYMEEQEQDGNPGEVSPESGIDLAQHNPEAFYTTPYIWIMDGLKNYPDSYASLCKERETVLALKTRSTVKNRQGTVDWCQSLNFPYSQLVFPCSILPEKIKFEGLPSQASPYRIASFLSPITMEMITALVTNQTLFLRDSTDDINSEALPPVLDRELCNVFHRITDVVAAERTKKKWAFKDNKGNLIKSYEHFIQTLMRCPSWAQEQTDFPTKVMLHYAWELLAHPRTICVFEKTIHASEEELYLKKEERFTNYKHALCRLRFCSSIPLVFGADQLILHRMPNMQYCHDYMRMVTATIYTCSGNDLHKAAALTKLLISALHSLFEPLDYPNCSAAKITSKTITGVANQSALVLQRMLEVLSVYTDHHYFDNVRQLRQAALCTKNSETPINLYGIKDGKNVSIEELN